MTDLAALIERAKEYPSLCPQLGLDTKALIRDLAEALSRLTAPIEPKGYPTPGACSYIAPLSDEITGLIREMEWNGVNVEDVRWPGLGTQCAEEGGKAIQAKTFEECLKICEEGISAETVAGQIRALAHSEKN